MPESIAFESFPKIARLFRDCIVTEKIDGTNAQILVTPDEVKAGSRNRWITPEADNFGFARWVQANADMLRGVLGEGRHFGEWWGPGIQRGYGLAEKRFSLFNVSKWRDVQPPLYCVPVLYESDFSTTRIEGVKDMLRSHGSFASPGFMRPEGIVVFHTASGQLFKSTLEDDEKPKGLGL
jgi:hypothetical protein